MMFDLWNKDPAGVGASDDISGAAGRLGTKKVETRKEVVVVGCQEHFDCSTS